MKVQQRVWRTGVIALAAAACGLAMTPVEADTGKLGGSWSGSGTVNLSNGKVEKARCRATFKGSGPRYSMNAVCATAAARAVQTAQVTQSGPNSWSGEFHNQEYNVSGSIRLVLHGGTLRASLNGAGASVYVTMSR